jgi:hypothetical protein
MRSHQAQQQKTVQHTTPAAERRASEPTQQVKNEQMAANTHKVDFSV